MDFAGAAMKRIRDPIVEMMFSNISTMDTGDQNQSLSKNKK